MPKIINTKAIPHGWREITEGEIVEIGDLYDYNSSNQSLETLWYPYRSIIGEKFPGFLTSIRRTDINAPLPPMHFSYHPSNTFKKKTNDDIKIKIKNYLLKTG